MPLYEYQCQSCGQRTEVLQSFSDAPRTVCEACGGELKKLISAPAVQFKGTGWYVTDYARKDTKTEAKETKESAKDTSANGNKEGSSSGKTGTEKAGKKDSSAKSSSKKE